MQGIRDDQWEHIKESLPGQEKGSERTGNDNRKFINAMMWIASKGAAWRTLPESYRK
ncbi:transposase [Holospora curviuscula]|uniref:Insertion element IS402-like domain-containing protein n=1 Tax=Holospora curviuscula TaxID=1082868 RepID=A0A2S5RE24_9PROT|nr:hypothetical protein HCUR_00212 [Holospora curviuscula]